MSRDLPRDICGLYDDRHKLILLADWLNQRQRRCTLCHELIHAKHHDPGCGSQYGLKCERRCRRETALADWYYKMYFTMLNRLFDSTNTYNVYVDIKDTHSAQRTEKLEEVLANSHYDFNHECIKKVQPIRSDEVQMMQITDVINGAVCRANRTTIPQPSGAKAEIIDYIRMGSKLRLTQSTTLGTRKFNIFVWEGRNA